MKICDTDIESGGKTYLNPSGARAIVENSTRRCATGVLGPDFLVISTISCSDHHSVAHSCGIELRDIDHDGMLVADGHVRFVMNSEGLSVDIWRNDEDEECVALVDQEARMVDLITYVRDHPLMRQMFRSGPFEIDLDIHNSDCQSVWKFDLEQGLTKVGYFLEAASEGVVAAP